MFFTLFVLLVGILCVAGAASMGKINVEKHVSVFGYIVGFECSEQRPFTFGIEKVAEK